MLLTKEQQKQCRQNTNGLQGGALRLLLDEGETKAAVRGQQRLADSAPLEISLDRLPMATRKGGKCSSDEGGIT